LQSMPNGRDMWALLAATPGVVMSRIDVAGNRAGTQTTYTAYGLTGQVRVLSIISVHDIGKAINRQQGKWHEVPSSGWSVCLEQAVTGDLRPWLA